MVPRRQILATLCQHLLIHDNLDVVEARRGTLVNDSFLEQYSETIFVAQNKLLIVMLKTTIIHQSAGGETESHPNCRVLKSVLSLKYIFTSSFVSTLTRQIRVLIAGVPSHFVSILCSYVTCLHVYLTDALVCNRPMKTYTHLSRAITKITQQFGQKGILNLIPNLVLHCLSNEK